MKRAQIPRRVINILEDHIDDIYGPVYKFNFEG